jgi:hypothetical protein
MHAAGGGEDLNLTGVLATPNPRLAAFDDLGAAGLVRALGAAAAASLAAAAILAGISVRPAWKPALSMLLLVALVGDVVRWRVMLTAERTRVLSAGEDAALALRPLPFVRRRSMEAADPARARIFAQPGPREHAARYDTLENVIVRDPPASPFIISHWMASVDRLLRASVRAPLDGAAAVTPQAWRPDSGALRPPYDRIIGQSADKLQVFTGARVATTDQEAADLINASGFTGDALILSSPGPASSGESRRVETGVEVLSFDGNHLRVKVSLPPGLPGGWLLYCDAWHPHWTGTVNGREVPVARAFLAYKAVPLDAGANVVEFRIRSPLRVWTFRLAAANAGAWVIGVAVLAAAALRRKATASRAVSGGA